MISYSWSDPVASELLHDELALRGFTVIHDRHSFVDGSRISSNMSSGVERCDAFVPYLTRSSLYLDGDQAADRPAVVGELLPALQRRRENLGAERGDRPVIVPVAHGLGGRAATAELVRRVTGEDIGGLWGSVWLDQQSKHILPHEAAAVADATLHAVLERDRPEGPVDVTVVTRGSSPVSNAFTVDATRLLGGDRRPGESADWSRFLIGLRSLVLRLETVVSHRSVRLDVRCHLSAAIATGRVLHQASGWSLTVATRADDAAPAEVGDLTTIAGDFDQHRERGDLIVDIDLIGHDVATLASELAAGLPPIGGRLSLRWVGDGDLDAETIAAVARGVADRVRTAHGKTKPGRIHLAVAAPAAFGALLGHHLTSLRADLVTYELDADGSYVTALTIPADTP